MKKATDITEKQYEGLNKFFKSSKKKKNEPETVNKGKPVTTTTKNQQRLTIQN